MTMTIETKIRKVARKLLQYNADYIQASARFLDMNEDEFRQFHELLKNSDLSPTDRQLVCGYLGDYRHIFNEQPPAVKIVLTHLFAELLKCSC